MHFGLLLPLPVSYCTCAVALAAFSCGAGLTAVDRYDLDGSSWLVCEDLQTYSRPLAVL